MTPAPGLRAPGVLRAGSAPLTARSSLLGRHLPFLVLLVAGTGLRALVQLGFRPVLWFLGDSAAYLDAANTLQPYVERPIAGSLLWTVLSPLHELAAVAAVQHLLGLAGAVVVYALLLRLGAPRWAATLGAAPLLLDGLVVELEQSLVAEPVFLALEVLAVALVLWERRPPVWAVALGGLAAGCAAVTRSVGLGLVVAVCVLLVARRVGALRLATGFVACSLPVLGYAAAYAHVHGAYAVTQSTGHFLYGRLAPVATCAADASMPPQERALCDPRPVGQRPGLSFYTWSGDSPYYRTLPADRAASEAVTTRWALHVVRHQPLDYARLVLDDLGRTFAPTPDLGLYAFTPTYPALPPYAQQPAEVYQAGRPGDTRVDRGLQGPLAAYQRVATVPGLAYALAMLVALLGAVLGRDPAGRGLRSATTALLLAAAAVLGLPALLAGYDTRYLVPAMPLLSVAAVLGVLLLAARWRERARPGGPGEPAPAR